MSQFGASVKNSIFRKDWKPIFASNRHLGAIHNLNLQYDANGYEPGQVLAPTGALYCKYSLVSGTQAAKAVLFDQISASESSGTVAANCITQGELLQANLIDLSAQAITDLKGVSITLGTGTVLFKF